MKNNKGVLLALLAFSLLLVPFAGCAAGQGAEDSAAEDGGQSAFSYSDGIDGNGYWQGITALDYVEPFDPQAVVIPSGTHTIADESVQSQVDSIVTFYSIDNEITDRAVEDGDTVNIDYVGSVDGVEFDGGTTQGMGTDVTIGVTNYIDDFLEQLIGHTPGETMNVEVTFPEDYANEELGGKDAVFVTTINYIVETVMPELTDDFVSENLTTSYGWTTVEEMNNEIYSNLQKSAIMSYVQEYLMENVTIRSLPDEVLAYVENSMIRYYEEGAEYYDMEMEEFLTVYEGVSGMEELLELNHDSNVAEGSYYIAVQAVAETADITVSDDDVKAYFIEYVGTDDYSEYEEEYGMPYLKQVVLNQLVLDYIAEHATLE